MSFTHLLTNDNITVYVRGVGYTIPRESVCFKKVVELIASDDVEAMQAALTPESVITRYAGSQIMVKDGRAYYGQRQLAPVLETRLLDYIKNGIPHDSYIRFLENLYANTSLNSITQLYPFLEYANLPITQDGCFLAYKAITHNWLDKHTRSIDNHVGKRPWVGRSYVDDNPDAGCSFGLHVGNLEYVKGFAYGYGEPEGDRIILVKVNPKDVVSVPHDCEHQKVRVSEYLVIGEFTGPLPGVAVDDNQRDLSVPEDDDAEDEVAVYTESEMMEMLKEEREDAYEQAKRDVINALR